MKGLEATEITFDELSKGVTFRFDSDYFQKKYLAHVGTVETQKSNFRYFDDLDLMIDGSAFYPSIEPYYGEGNLPFLRVADVDTVIDFHNGTTIPAELCSRFPTLKRVAKGDVVLTKGGSVARVGLVTQEAAACRDLIFINSAKLPERDYTFLSLYFQTQFANDLLVRSSSQTAQPHLTLTLVRDIPIFWGSIALREAVLRTVQKSYKERSLSVEGYARAEQTLLEGLALDTWQPPEPNAYESTFASAFAADRLDAEHFQPKYAELLKQLRSTNRELRSLSELIEPVRNGFDNRDFVAEGTPYIRVGDVRSGQIDTEGAEKVAMLSAEVNKDVGLRVGDILFTRKGSYGNAAVVREGQENSIISSEIMLLRRKVQDINPDYLALYLSALPGRQQVEQWVHGAAFFSISQEDISQIKVVMLPEEVQGDIAQAVLDAHDARARAKCLLEKAKRAVEVAIEDGEDAGLALLNEA